MSKELQQRLFMFAIVFAVMLIVAYAIVDAGNLQKANDVVALAATVVGFGTTLWAAFEAILGAVAAQQTRDTMTAASVAAVTVPPAVTAAAGVALMFVGTLL